MQKAFLWLFVLLLPACSALGLGPNPADVAKLHYDALNSQDQAAVISTYLPDQQSSMSSFGAGTNIAIQVLTVSNIFGAETEQLVNSIKNSPFTYSNLEYKIVTQKANEALVQIKGNIKINVYDTTVPYCDYLDLQYVEEEKKWYIDGLTDAKKIRFETMIQKKTAKFAELALTIGLSILGGSSLSDPQTVKMILPYFFDQCSEVK
jgi:hypothetical protein